MHPLLLDTGVSSQLADEACILHPWTDELLIQQKSDSDGDHSQSFSHFLPHLIDLRQRGQLCIKGHPHERAVLTQWIGSLKRCTSRGLGMRLPTFANSITGPFETMGILHSFTHCSRSLRYDSRQLTSYNGLRDVATMAVSSA